MSEEREVRLSWQADAACRGVSPDLFFPEDEASETAAKAICATCPVRVSCLAFALAREQRYGIWGGLNERERRKISPSEARRIIARAEAA